MNDSQAREAAVDAYLKEHPFTGRRLALEWSGEVIDAYLKALPSDVLVSTDGLVRVIPEGEREGIERTVYLTPLEGE